MNRPAVLHLVDSFHQGGSERQGLQTARLLHETGRYQVYVAGLHPQGSLRDEVESWISSPILEYPISRFYDANAVRQYRRLAIQLRKLQVDIVHTHDFYSNIFGMLAGALARVPVRITSRRQTARRPWAKRLAERWAHGLSHAVVANCEAVSQLLRQEGIPQGKIFVIYNGVDLRRVGRAQDLDRAALIQALRLPCRPQQRLVTMVANLRPVKDHATFLRAAAQIRAAVPEAAFVIAGEGPLLESLRCLAKDLGVEECTFFLGRCEALADLLACSEVGVLSSQSEGFSNSILEYMAAGLPVVATGVGGAREAVREGETGFLVAVGDAAGMAHRIINLLCDPERARAMGIEGRRWVEENFSSATQLARTEQLYQRLLSPHLRT